MGKTRTREQTRQQGGYNSNPSDHDRMIGQNFKEKIDKTPLSPKTEKQRKYMNSIIHNTVTISTGPAGTGKTYIATKLACQALHNGEVDKIYITRPMVEAGEEEPELGALPGSELEKTLPHFMSVVSIIQGYFGKSFFEYLVKMGRIEMVPIALMRGRSFADCYLLCDEMQNASESTMKLILTRIGENCKVIIDGDVSQKDIKVSGLDDLLKRLEDHPIKGVNAIEFELEDVVRSGICKEFLKMYSK